MQYLLGSTEIHFSHTPPHPNFSKQSIVPFVNFGTVRGSKGYNGKIFQKILLKDENN